MTKELALWIIAQPQLILLRDMTQDNNVWMNVYKSIGWMKGTNGMKTELTYTITFYNKTDVGTPKNPRQP